MNRERLLVLVGSAASVALAITLSARFFPCTVDDAYITYRYALHAAQGQLAFNLGGPPVEGFSSPFWLALLTLVAVVTGPGALPLASTALGLLSLTASIVCAFILGARCAATSGPARFWAGLLAACTIALTPAAQYYAVTGLEPMLFVLAILTTLGAAVGAFPQWLGLLAAGLATWIRPEGPFLIAPLVACALVRRDRRKSCIRLGAAVALGALSVLIVRYALFTDVVPNTYYAKSPNRLTGYKYLRDQVFDAEWARALALLGVLGAALARGPALIFALSGLIWLIAPILEGGDWMPLGRMALPAFACFALAAGGIAAQKKTWLSVALTLAALGLLGHVALPASEVSAAREQALRQTLHQEARSVAWWLRGKHVRSVALVDIGQIGFYSRAEIIDLVGLTDVHIASAQGRHLHKQLDVNYVIEQRKPEVIVLRVSRAPFKPDGSLDTTTVMALPERTLAESKLFEERYTLALSRLPSAPRNPYYGLLIYRLRSSR